MQTPMPSLYDNFIGKKIAVNFYAEGYERTAKGTLISFAENKLLIKGDMREWIISTDKVININTLG